MSTRVNKGFTLVEWLVSVVIFGIFMAIATPTFVSAMNSATTQQCRANMQVIAGLDIQYRMRSASHSYTTNLNDLQGQVPVVPACPSGGTYTLTISNGSMVGQSGKTVANGGLVVTCSSLNHGRYAPSADAD